MPIKSFDERYEVSKSQIKTRLLGSNIHDNGINSYASISSKKAYYLRKNYVLNCINEELSKLVTEFGITKTEIEENFQKITQDIIETLQQEAIFQREVQKNNYTTLGVMDLENKIIQSNEFLFDPKNKAEVVELFAGESKKKFFNNILPPNITSAKLDRVMGGLNDKSTNEQIKNGLLALATIKKIHDSRPFFGRPEHFSEETSAIELGTKLLRGFGFTENDLSTIFNSSDEKLIETINDVYHNRFEVEKEKETQDNYSRRNIDRISPYNLFKVFKVGKTKGITGATSAKHPIKVLNAYITAKNKYNKAGFFTKYFNKEYRDLKKSIDEVEKYLTMERKGTPQDTEKIFRLFTKQQLKELANRQEPLTVDKDLKFLKEHNFNTIEKDNDIKENGNKNSIIIAEAKEQSQIELNNQGIGQPQFDLNNNRVNDQNALDDSSFKK